MVCHCKSPEEHASRAVTQATDNLYSENKRLEKKLADLTPDNTNFKIMIAEEVAGNLVLKVRYSSCKHRSFEGDKIMVFQGVTATDALKWETIDPHFTKDKKRSPVARFRPDENGWVHAIEWAKAHICND